MTVSGGEAGRDLRQLFGGPLDGEFLDVTGMPEEDIRDGFYLPFPQCSEWGERADYTPDGNGVIRFLGFIP